MKTNITLYESLHNTYENYPDRNALLFMKKYIDYKTLIAKADSLAKGFMDLGIKKGNVVTLAMPNAFESLFAFYALNKLGVVCHMVHPLTPVKQMKKFMETTKSKHLIIFDSFYNYFKAILEEENTKLILASPVTEFGLVKKFGYKVINRKKLKNIKYGERTLKLEDLYKEGEVKPIKINPKDTAFLLHSGGTSGEPKTIELSNSAVNYLANQIPFIMGIKDFEDYHMLAVLPMFHGFGLCMGIHGFLMHGGVDTLMPKFSSDEVVRLVKEDQCNIIIGVPSIFEALLRNKKFKSTDIKNIKQAYVGGDYVAKDLKERFDSVMEYYYSQARLLEGYGLTEVVTVSCVNTLKAHNQESVGKPLPGIRVGIVNQKTNEFLSPNIPGEIVVSGPTMMNGYLNDTEATEKTIIEIDGEKWLKTGDLGLFDDSGYVHYKQRLKRIIKVSGVSVLPSEIENLLMSQPEIQEVAAISKPDKEKGNRVKLFVVWNKDKEKLEADKIKQLIKENISSYAVPNEIVEMKELPKTIIGKTNILELEKL